MTENEVFLEDLITNHLLRPGLIGLSNAQNSLVGKLISASENFWSETPVDEPYSHAWMVHDYSGTTWEQRWRLNYYSMSSFLGQRILIFSHPKLTTSAYEALHATHIKKRGRFYPPLRLLLFWTPPGFRRCIDIGLRVCSETVGYYLKGVGVISDNRGISPHGLHLIAQQAGCRIICEGILATKMEA